MKNYLKKCLKSNHDTDYLKVNKERHFKIVESKMKEMNDLGYLKEQYESR